jgi:hypothetical protein
MPEPDDDWSASTSATGTGPDGEFDPDAGEGIDAVLGFALPPPVEKPRRARINIATTGLVALALVAAAFYAGVKVEKTHAKSSTAGGLAAAFGRLAATGAATSGTRGAGSGAFGGIGAGVTIGTVKLIDGKNVYVTTTSGAITKVIVGSGSKVTVTKSGKASDLKPGDSVVVQGAASKDGSITATSLSDSGTGSSGSGFGGFGGGGALPSGGAYPGGAVPSGAGG